MVEVCEVFTVVIAVVVDVETDAVVDVCVIVVEEVGIVFDVGVDVEQEPSNIAARTKKIKLNPTTLFCIVYLHLI